MVCGSKALHQLTTTAARGGLEGRVRGNGRPPSGTRTPADSCSLGLSRGILLTWADGSRNFCENFKKRQ